VRSSPECLCSNIRRQQNENSKQEARTIIVFDEAIEEQARHSNSTTGEVWVVVHPFTYFDTSRRINIAGKEREQVVLPDAAQLKHLAKEVICAYSTTVASLDDQTKVGRERALVRSPGSLVVGVRARHVIR
jgi:hypothetical protein